MANMIALGGLRYAIVPSGSVGRASGMGTQGRAFESLRAQWVVI